MKIMKWMSTLAFVLVVMVPKAEAMTMNLAMKWDDGCSFPQTPFLSFYSPQRESLLFDGESVIELRCQAGLRSVGLKWTLHRNLINTPFRTGMAEPLPGNKFASRREAYYDPMNFAPDIHCPVLMSAGLIDPVSPPSCVFAIYRRLGAPQKEMVALDGLGHDWSAEFDRQARRWLEHILGIESKAGTKDVGQ